nr:orf40 [Trichoplusia ni single nucleopolyhedrovirus]
MMSTTSVSNGGADIFERKKIKLLSYDEYHQLSRFKFIKFDSLTDKYFYYDKYTQTEVSTSRSIVTLNDYPDYLFLVY